MVRRIVYVKLEHPSGRVTTKKLKVSARTLKEITLKGIQKEYLGTAEHFRTEAYPIAIVKKPKRKRRRTTYGFPMPRLRF